MLISFMPHFCVSPGLIAGSGLKRGMGWRFGGVIVVSPGLIAGSGLKPIPDNLLEISEIFAKLLNLNAGEFV